MKKKITDDTKINSALRHQREIAEEIRATDNMIAAAQTRRGDLVRELCESIIEINAYVQVKQSIEVAV